MTIKKGNLVDLNRRRQETREEALERLFREHETALRSFLQKRLKDKSEIEDIAQDVFIRLARMPDLEVRLSSGRARKNRNFLFTVANNIVVDQERRKVLQREYNSSQQELTDRVNKLGPEEMAEAGQVLSLVKTAILNLKPTWRKAFTMSRFNYMNYKEISEEMGVSVKQVESYITSALATLREAALDSSGTAFKDVEKR